MVIFRVVRKAGCVVAVTATALACTVGASTPGQADTPSSTTGSVSAPAVSVWGHPPTAAWQRADDLAGAHRPAVDAEAGSHATAGVTTKVVLRRFRHGRMVDKRVLEPSDFHSAARGCAAMICHFVGRAGPQAGGTARVDTVQTGQSFAGFDLWRWDVWTKWSWDHSDPYCIHVCTVHMIDKGAVGKSLDQFWDFDKVTARDDRYLTSCNAHCDYHHSVQGEFSGPNALGQTAHRFATNTLNSYNDGTYEWWLDCCSQ
jgi:hypothetical protein